MNSCFKALSEDGSAIYHPPSTDHPSKALKRLDHINNILPETLFGKQFLVAALDEVHSCRNLKSRHHAARALRECAQLMVGMTATPVTTKPIVSNTIHLDRIMLNDF